MNSTFILYSNFQSLKVEAEKVAACINFSLEENSETIITHIGVMMQPLLMP